MIFRHTFTALKYPNYRLWFYGQIVSLFGTWMQITAQSFLVFELTHSPAYLGYISFAFGAPSWLFMLYGGVIADRMSRRTLLIITQSCMMIPAFILALFTFSGWIQPWHLLIIAFAMGVTSAFDAPARHAFVFEMVGREDLTNAIALNSTLFNSSAAVGPALAGIVYVLLGPGWCFAINGISFIAIIVALLMMNIKAQPLPVQKTSTYSSLKEGIRYVVSDPLMLPLICTVAVTTLFGFSFSTLMPAWAVNVLDGDAATNGFLQGARGAGSVLSALLIASLGRFRFKGKLLTTGTFVFPLMLLSFALARWIPLSLLIMVCLGAALLLILNLGNALIQTLVSDELRGRVMSIYSLTHFGFMPIGGLLAGGVAEYIGEPVTVALGSFICLTCSVMIFIFVPNIHKLE
jgi:MFS family permease